MKHFIIILFSLIFLIKCGEREKNNKQFINEYIKAANAHNIEKVRAMYSDSIIWHLGPYTLKGKDDAIAPLWFDKGANTVLKASNVMVNGDTIDCNLLERNDVLTEYGINELHHFPRFIIKNGLIETILSRKPPLENQAFVDSITAFAKWLSVNSPEEYKKFWPEGKFNFSQDRGKAMPVEIKKWRERNNQSPE
jgi:hypothetical protein